MRKFGIDGKETLEDCQAECDKTARCYSIGVCPSDGCYLYDKYITKGVEQKTNVNCYTSYIAYSRNIFKRFDTVSQSA